MKVLKAYGTHRRSGHQWNWCNTDELVGQHGFVCDNSCTCGCAESFTGLKTNKATNQAIVCDMPEDEVAKQLQAFMK